eukprot:GHUV01047505.1.p3 GENE.GHUV01047505.1~~GHUV01047505.1.p3  ORF type:complete len:127 (+),score=14.38 GHUV01047505.1:256-636(+)
MHSLKAHLVAACLCCFIIARAAGSPVTGGPCSGAAVVQVLLLFAAAVVDMQMARLTTSRCTGVALLLQGKSGLQQSGYMLPILPLGMKGPRSSSVSSMPLRLPQGRPGARTTTSSAQCGLNQVNAK